MTHGWGSCQGEGRQGHSGQGQAEGGRQEEVGSEGEGGTQVSDRTGKKEAREGWKEGRKRYQ